MNPLLQTGAFVVQFRRGTSFATGIVQGRIEHVASGWNACFDSQTELIERLGQAFDAIDAAAASSDTSTPED
jgi:hypothetical protein